MKSDTIRGYRLTKIYNPIFELTLEQINIIDEVCKPFINEDAKPNINNAIIYVSSANKSKIHKCIWITI